MVWSFLTMMMSKRRKKKCVSTVVLCRWQVKRKPMVESGYQTMTALLAVSVGGVCVGVDHYDPRKFLITVVAAAVLILFLDRPALMGILAA